jgi:hypothetical protein
MAGVILLLRARWRNTHQMPSLLRMFCQGGMVAAPLLFLASVVPMGGFSVNGKNMSYREFWLSGAGLSAAVLALLIAVGCWGLASRSSNSRWALVLSPLVPSILISIVDPGAFDTSAPLLVLESAASAGVIYMLLFRIRAIQRYLEGGERKRF